MALKPRNNVDKPRATWWTDIRFERERKFMLILGAILVIVVAGTIVFMYVSASKQEPLEETKSASMVLPAKEREQEKLIQVETQKPTELEEVTQHILAGQLGQASIKLQEIEIQLARLQGIVAWKQGNIELAEELFTKALALDPNSTPDQVNLAGVKLLQSKAVEAVQLLKKAHNTNPSNAYIGNRYLLAKIEAGELESVKVEVATALEISPENGSSQVIMAAAAIELAEGYTANAKTLLEAAQGKLDPGVFYSLLAERPIAIYSTKPELKEFFDKKQ